MSSQIVMPGQVPIEFNHLPGPLAQPVGVTLQSAGGYSVMAIGGLTPLEHGALQIAAALAPLMMAGSQTDRAIHGIEIEQVPAEIAQLSCAVAAATLACCHRAQTAAPKVSD